MTFRNHVHLEPTDNLTQSFAECSQYDLTIRLRQPALPETSTPLQLFIERDLALRKRSFVVALGWLEFGFDEHSRLQEISLFLNFDGAAEQAIRVPEAGAFPASITFTDADPSQDHAFHAEAKVRAVCDRRANRVRVDVDGGHAVRWHGLADTLLLGTDAAGGIASLLALDVRWKREPPPPPRSGLLDRLKRTAARRVEGGRGRCRDAAGSTRSLADRRS